MTPRRHQNHETAKRKLEVLTASDVCRYQLSAMLEVYPLCAHDVEPVPRFGTGETPRTFRRKTEGEVGARSGSVAAPRQMTSLPRLRPVKDGVTEVTLVTAHENRAIPSETSEVGVLRIPDIRRQVPDGHGIQTCGYIADVRADPEVQDAIRCRASTGEQRESREIEDPTHEVASWPSEGGKFLRRRRKQNLADWESFPRVSDEPPREAPL